MNFHAFMDEDELMSSDLQKPNATEFQQIVEMFEPKRFYSGVECILQFKQDPKYVHLKNKSIQNESYFYCKLCLSRLNKQYLMPHCASFVHLFRYFKHMYPIEYDRVISPNNLKDSIEYVTKLLGLVCQRQADLDNVPELILVDHLDSKFREFTENFSKRNRPVDLKNIKLNELTNLNLDDEDRILEENRNAILRNNTSSHNSFIQHLIDSNRDDFISIPTGEERFANHKSTIRQRERGSMKTSHVVIKQEKENQMETEPIEPTEPNPSDRQIINKSPVHQEPEVENDVEEISDDDLKKLANRIMITIEKRNQNIDDGFIDSCTKYAELLIYKEYIDIESMEKLQILFMQDNSSEQAETNNCPSDQSQHEPVLQNFKQSPKIPEEPQPMNYELSYELGSNMIMQNNFHSDQYQEDMVQNFKQSPKIPEEPQPHTMNYEFSDELGSNQHFVDASSVKTERDLGY